MAVVTSTAGAPGEMDSSEIKTVQAAKIGDALRPGQASLYRLKERMERRGFPPDDPYYHLVGRAREALYHLSLETHYLSCRHGVSPPERE